MKVFTLIAFLMLPVAILTAQEPEWSPSPLVLRKGDQTVSIPVGDWVVAVDSSDNLLVSGKLVGKSNGELITLHYGRPAKIPPGRRGRASLDSIQTLYHGEAKRVWHYFGKGCGYGFLLGAASGSLIGLYFAITDEYSGPGPLLGGPLLGSILTTPGGGVSGLIRGLKKHRKAIIYQLGPDEWHIISEDAP